jgi:hypothetical protein
VRRAALEDAQLSALAALRVRRGFFGYHAQLCLFLPRLFLLRLRPDLAVHRQRRHRHQPRDPARLPADLQRPLDHGRARLHVLQADQLLPEPPALRPVPELGPAQGPAPVVQRHPGRRLQAARRHRRQARLPVRPDCQLGLQRCVRVRAVDLSSDPVAQIPTRRPSCSTPPARPAASRTT